SAPKYATKSAHPHGLSTLTFTLSFAIRLSPAYPSILRSDVNLFEFKLLVKLPLDKSVLV
ncbi:MAG TPA: hypothetical protein PKD15_05765, partial [Candidatus Saccharibacteria bacterium]|nr:hypothetical protein [Candidatus Saccharibacteria bacterium]